MIQGACSLFPPTQEFTAPETLWTTTGRKLGPFLSKCLLSLPPQFCFHFSPSFIVLNCLFFIMQIVMLADLKILECVYLLCSRDHRTEVFFLLVFAFIHDMETVSLFVSARKVVLNLSNLTLLV